MYNVQGVVGRNIINRDRRGGGVVSGTKGHDVCYQKPQFDSSVFYDGLTP